MFSLNLISAQNFFCQLINVVWQSSYTQVDNEMYIRGIITLNLNGFTTWKEIVSVGEVTKRIKLGVFQLLKDAIMEYEESDTRYVVPPIYYKSCKFNTDIVEIFVSYNYVVTFKVNKECKRVKGIKSSNKIAITKWLLSEFKILKNKFDVLYCVPLRDDWEKEGENYRAKVYSKLGFCQVSDSPCLIWKK